ncbi:T9SS type A sorting domain-containing protein [Flavobacterium sp. ZT3R18]|uniref:reprolysin-like metallopeptidase n=1 Tax=Flavobacterium sp. ZT3R18 TaxID=2594429 RepID=UPI0011798DBD|nr:zinc-dependent metalloprotease family protein [Flavobacterium sp. ZT3R18]TRX38676.1 T9SS type A sorting domain-containing protein [Flavobacterium sp. ZT3R18]
MKKQLLSIAFLAFSGLAFAQGGSYWKATSKTNGASIAVNKTSLNNARLFSLDINGLKQTLASSPKRSELSKVSKTIVSFPNENGQMENFRILEAPNMDPALAAKYPDIKAYVGQGIENPTATIHFSVSALGVETMLINADKSAVFIEPYTTDLNTYTVYKKSDKTASLSKFECTVVDQAKKEARMSGTTFRPNADDGLLRTFRLALSVTAEYTTYFGGTKALALAAMNNTMTRVNGVFETDCGVHMNMIANNDLLIYTNAATDPYSVASTGQGGAWNTELQNTLTSVIGNAGYDIGHLFGASGGGGNAGCIGCVCVDDTSSTTDKNKGSGFTSPGDAIPSGDNFDIDYVAHEMGHQFGGNHTFTHSNEGTIAQVEPGSGSTIMGYAGITSLDVQPHSDAFFHAVTIQQITNNIKSKTCSVNTATGNSVPTASAGLDYTIPKSTPFMLTGAGTDANGDNLTYNWEQMDVQTTSAAPAATKTTGVQFRSYNSSVSATRYFPKMSSTLAGATTTAGTELTVEALNSVARTMNFRLTVRDNHLGSPANNSDDMIVTVNATAGPFAVSAPNTAVSYVGGSSQTVTWAVAGTTANGVNCANVDVLLSTDGGLTFPTVLLAATPNDGTQAVTIPNIAGTTNRIMVKGTNHIFFDVSNTNFTITSGVVDTVAPTAPTALAATGTTTTGTNLSWTASTDNVGVTGYDVYQNGVLKTTVTGTTYAVTGLTPTTTYNFTVKAKDAAGNISVVSNTAAVTTLTPVVDTTAPTAPTALAAAGTTTTTTNLSWTAATDNVAVTGYDVYQGATLKATVTGTTYTVTGLTAATAYTFSVKAKDAAGNISVASNVVNVTTLTVALTYCASQGNSVADEKIGKVALGTISNVSTGGTGYENFTAISTNLVLNTANTITITPVWTATVYKEGYAVWIDYNQNGLFTDAGELVFSKAASTATPATGSFTVPATALLGATRMRVSMKYNAIPTACEAFSYGQVEDYTVNITSVAKEMTAKSSVETAMIVYPNPTSSVLNVTSVSESATYRVYSILGQSIAAGRIVNGTIDVSNINIGNYILEVNDNDTVSTRRFVKK